MKPIWPSNYSNKYQLKDELASADGKVSLIGAVSLEDVKIIKGFEYNVIDLSQAICGEEIETYSVGMGKYSLSRRHRTVDVLTKLLEVLDALEVILPDYIAKRHMNVISKNIRIYSIRVLDTCRLYAMQGGEVYNKKKTLLEFSPRPLDLQKCTCCGKDIPYFRLYHIPKGCQKDSRLRHEIGDEMVCKNCFKAHYEKCVYCGLSYRRDTMIRDCGYWTGYYCPSCAKEFE